MNNRLVPKAKWGIFTKSFWTGKKSTPKIDPFDAALEHAYSVLDSENKRLDNFRAQQKADMEWNTDMSRIDNMLKDAYSTLQDQSLNPYRKPTPTITASPEDAVADNIFMNTGEQWMQNQQKQQIARQQIARQQTARQRRLAEYSKAAAEDGLDTNAIKRIQYLADLDQDGIYGPETQSYFWQMVADGSPSNDKNTWMNSGYISGLGWYDPKTAKFYENRYGSSPENYVYGSSFKEATERAGKTPIKRKTTTIWSWK